MRVPPPMEKRKSLLQITKKTPVPPRDGESVAIHQFTEMLLAEYDVTVLAMLTPKHRLSADWDDFKLKNAVYHFCEVDTTTTVPGALLNFFKPLPYIVERFYCKNFEAELIALLQQNAFDLIHLEGIFPAMYVPVIRKYSKAAIVLRAHNVEHQIWQRLAVNEPNVLKKFYYEKILVPELKNFELNYAAKCDALVPISEQDEVFFSKHLTDKPCCTIPVGYQYFPEVTKSEGKFTIGFLGALDWLPNIEGLQWFLNHVWTDFYARHTDAELVIAGRNMPDDMAKLNVAGLKVVGEVQDAAAFMADKTLMIVPLLSGSGMRIKIVEAMALGKCVLSTSVGAEGVEAHNNRDFLLADTPKHWVEILGNLHENSTRADEIARNGQNFIKENYRLDVIGEKLLHFYSQFA